MLLSTEHMSTCDANAYRNTTDLVMNTVSTRSRRLVVGSTTKHSASSVRSRSNSSSEASALRTTNTLWLEESITSPSLSHATTTGSSRPTSRSLQISKLTRNSLPVTTTCPFIPRCSMGSSSSTGCGQRWVLPCVIMGLEGNDNT